MENKTDNVYAENEEKQEQVEEATVTPKTNKKKIAFIAGAVVLVAALGVGVAVASGQPEEVAAPEPVVIKEEKKAEEKSTISVALKADAIDTAVAVEGKVKVVDSKGKTVIKETETEFGKAFEIGELAAGKYELELTVAPILEDGTTFKLPEEAIEFEVKDDGKEVKVELALEVLALEDMTAEELEEAAAALESSGNAELAAKAHEVAQTGPSSNSGGSSNAAGGSSSGGSIPTPAKHAPIHSTRSVLIAEAYSYNEPIYGSICNGCGANITGFTSQHMKDAGRESACQSYREGVVGNNVINVPAVYSEESYLICGGCTGTH